MRALNLPCMPPCELEMSLKTVEDSTHILKIRSAVPTFGPQPWLALKTTSGTYHHDNFDIDEPFHRWQYVFDKETFPLNALSSVGVATNNAIGVATVALLDPVSGKSVRRFWNAAN